MTPASRHDTVLVRREGRPVLVRVRPRLPPDVPRLPRRKTYCSTACMDADKKRLRWLWWRALLLRPWWLVREWFALGFDRYPTNSEMIGIVAFLGSLVVLGVTLL
jgi:hypothetical protein